MEEDRVSNEVRKELFSTLMDDEGYIDSYTNAKKISSIAFQQDREVDDVCSKFIDDCIERGIEPSLELVRLEEDQNKLEQEKEMEMSHKYYTINRELAAKLPKDLPKDVLDGLHRVQTSLQLDLTSQNTFVLTVDNLINNFLTQNEDGMMEIGLDNSYERLICHNVANYYNLQSYSTGVGKMRVTRVSSKDLNKQIPSIQLTRIFL